VLNTDVQIAIDIVSGLVSEVLAYLHEAQERLGELPRFYPKHFQFDEVRVKVKVSEERRKYDEIIERERERLRREGLTDFDDERQSPYLRRSLPEEGDEVKRPEIRILDWDKEVREKLQRGVILGDPGFGKTWLLCYEGRLIAREQAEKLKKREIGLSEVIIPIFIRLSDLARTPGEIERRFANSSSGITDAMARN
jgi:hypothetical protein